MRSFGWKAILAGALVLVAVIGPDQGLAQSNVSPAEIDHPRWVSIIYEPPENPALQDLYDLLRERHALESIQEILMPFRSPEALTIKTAECKAINAWYRRETFKPTVTVCYELLKHILGSLPNEDNPDGLTPADVAVGQFFFATLHEVGHAIFDILDVPMFGHEEDAADNFATYIMLQFGERQAHRLIGGAAWSWRAYLGDYKKNPVVPTRLSAFASDHGLPQERFYNLICLAFGADRIGFADFATYLPSTRAPTCWREYGTLVRAFEKEITLHIDQEVARQVLHRNWLEALESGSVPPK
jgi:hypothetical protein